MSLSFVLKKHVVVLCGKAASANLLADKAGARYVQSPLFQVKCASHIIYFVN